MNNVKVRVEQL